MKNNESQRDRERYRKELTERIIPSREIDRDTDNERKIYTRETLREVLLAKVVRFWKEERKKGTKERTK